MEIWHSLDDVPEGFGPSVAVIGNFDGVHLGHRRVLARAHELAADQGLPVVAITFDPHPMAVLRPDHAPTQLTTLEARAELLAVAGANAVLALPFDLAMAAWSPDEFAQRVLVDCVRAAVVVVGANFRFGRRAAGDVTSLKAFGARRDVGFTVEGIALDGGPMVWSSTYVRTCLAAGDVTGAAEALGRPYSVRGVVVRGDQRGRELGYPTANVPTDGLTAAPADGVYAGWLTRLDTGERFPAAISVGTNPTFHGVRERRVESFVLDRDDPDPSAFDLYGVDVEVAFVARLRGMVTFDSVDALVEHMADDVSHARAILNADPT